MMTPSDIELDTDRTTRIERMLDLVPKPDLRAMEETRRRLVGREEERWHGRPSPRRRQELDALIEADVASLAVAIKKVTSATESSSEQRPARH